jgi:hypothetical protein
MVQIHDTVGVDGHGITGLAVDATLLFFVNFVVTAGLVGKFQTVGEKINRDVVKVA